MKSIIVFFLFNSVSIICAIGAVILAYDGKPGWGWMLLVAVLSQSTKVTSTISAGD